MPLDAMTLTWVPEGFKKGDQLHRHLLFTSVTSLENVRNYLEVMALPIIVEVLPLDRADNYDSLIEGMFIGAIEGQMWGFYGVSQKHMQRFADEDFGRYVDTRMRRMLDLPE